MGNRTWKVTITFSEAPYSPKPTAVTVEVTARLPGAALTAGMVEALTLGFDEAKITGIVIKAGR